MFEMNYFRDLSLFRASLVIIPRISAKTSCGRRSERELQKAQGKEKTEPILANAKLFSFTAIKIRFLLFSYEKFRAFAESVLYNERKLVH